MKVKMTKTLKIDTNGGFSSSVDKDTNDFLIDLQVKQGVKAEDIKTSLQTDNGRFAYVIIEYITEYNEGDLDV